MEAHTPVLRAVVVDLLKPQSGETVLDVTLGLGGHAESFVKAIGPDGHLIGLDADEENLRRAQERLKVLPGKKTFHHANFRDLPSLNLPQVNVLFADLGLSSPHIDEPERGFSFRADGPLDFRFDRSKGQSAAQLIESAEEKELQQIFQQYGEMRQAGKLAAAVIRERPQTTQALRGCVEDVCGFRAKSVLPQVFQALRIAVNDELGALGILLQEGPRLLASGGRMGVISYHSLEDRPVKQVFRSLTTPVKSERTGAVTQQAPFELLTKKALVPTDDEAAKNPRSRSAKLRAIRRTDSAPVP